MGTAIYHLAQADHFLRRARDATAAPRPSDAAAATQPPAAAASRPDAAHASEPLAAMASRPDAAHASEPLAAMASRSDTAHASGLPKAAAASVPPAADASGPQAALHALRRAASHAATALTVSAGLRHSSRRRLTTGIHNAVITGRFSRSHLKTFRQTHDFSADLQVNADAVPPSAMVLRRLRRRVAAFIRDATALLDGTARTVRPAQRFLRIAYAADPPPPVPARIPQRQHPLPSG